MLSPPDDGQILLSSPRRSLPLLQHHHRLPVDNEAAEKEGNGRHKHDPHPVRRVVLGQAGAVEVKGGVNLHAGQGEKPADPIHHRLGVRLEVLEDHPEPIHGAPWAGAASPGDLLT